MIKAVQQFMLGTVLRNEKQARDTLQSISEAGYTGIELCRFMIHPISLPVRMLTSVAGMPVGGGGKLDWNAMVKDAELKVVSLHFDLDTLEKDVVAAAREACSFETEKIVITGMYGFDYTREDRVRGLAQRLNAAGKALNEQGVKLLYHNHNCELCRAGNDKRAFDILIEETDPEFVNFEFDSYWISEAGADPLFWMKRLGDRMKLWHINDRGSRTSGAVITPILKTDSVELGTGNMPLEELMKQAKRVGIEAVVLESHRNWIDKDPVKSLRLSGAHLHALMK